MIPDKNKLSPDRVLINDGYSLDRKHNKKFTTKINSFLITFIASTILFELFRLLIVYSPLLIDRGNLSANTEETLFALARFSHAACYLCVVVAGSFYYMIIIQQWKFVAKYSDISISKAVGFLFIPFYNFYWVFKIFAGYHESFNLMVKQNKLDKSFELDKSLGLTAAIMSIPNSIYNFLENFMFRTDWSGSVGHHNELMAFRYPLSGTLLTIWNITYVVVISLYFLQVYHHIDLVYAQIRANRA